MKDKLIVRTYRVWLSQDEEIKKMVRHNYGESEQVRQSIDLKIKVEQIKQKWIEDSKQWSKELKETIVANLFN